MTTPNVLKQLEEMMKDPKSASPEDLQALLQSSLQFFDEIQQKFASTDEAEKAKAQAVLLDVKEAIEKQTEALCKVIGVDISQLDAHLADSLDPEEAEAVRLVQKEIDQRTAAIQKTPQRTARKQRLIYT